MLTNFIPFSNYLSMTMPAFSRCCALGRKNGVESISKFKIGAEIKSSVSYDYSQPRRIAFHLIKAMLH